MPLINFAPPVKGKRELMCRTDETSISRIRAPFSKYHGMVERVQPVRIPKKDRGKGIVFHMKFSYCDMGSVYCPDEILYHIMKFLSLRAARSMFPDNIVNAHELRVFRKNDVAHTAMYSDFVSDDNGVIARRKDAMRRFYEKTSTEEKLQIKSAADKCERRMNPRLGPLVSEIRKTGYSLSHPEANYHVSEGTTVFFEIDGIEMHKLVRRIFPSQIDPDPAARLFLLMHALAIKGCAVMQIRTHNAELYPGSGDIARASLQKIYSILAALQAGLSLADEGRPGEFVKSGMKRWKDEYEDVRERTHHMDKQVRISRIIDPKVVKMLEQQRYPSL